MDKICFQSNGDPWVGESGGCFVKTIMLACKTSHNSQLGNKGAQLELGLNMREK